MRVPLAIAATLSAALFLSGCSSSNEKKEEAVGAPPAVYKVDFETSKGTFVAEIQTEWAPFGSTRIYELVRKGFFDDDRFFRVVRGFVVQFGINGNPAVNREWMTANIPDDPRAQHK